MLGVERYEKIMKLLEEHKIIKVSELSTQFNVTEKTIRSDLMVLEEYGRLKRIHGGAVLPNEQNVLPIIVRQSKFIEEKIAIAYEAIKLVEQEDTLFLDGGSTTLELAKKLGDFPVTVITNDIRIANTLVSKDLVNLMVLGGSQIQPTSALYGPFVNKILTSIRVNRLFLGTTAVSEKQGLSVYNHFQAEFKKQIISIANQVTLLADHTKFGKQALLSFAQFDDVDEIVTDQNLDKRYIKTINQAGIKLIISTDINNK